MVTLRCWCICFYEKVYPFLFLWISIESLDRNRILIKLWIEDKDGPLDACMEHSHLLIL